MVVPVEFNVVSLEEMNLCTSKGYLGCISQYLIWIDISVISFSYFGLPGWYVPLMLISWRFVFFVYLLCKPKTLFTNFLYFEFFFFWVIIKREYRLVYALAINSDIVSKWVDIVLIN